MSGDALDRYIGAQRERFTEELRELVEFGVTRELFTNPRNTKTEDYITGRFG